MQARIRVGSIHWVIVEQIEDPDTTHLLAEGGGNVSTFMDYQTNNTSSGSNASNPQQLISSCSVLILCW